MSVLIAFFRGINVGGKNILPMKELIAILEEKGCTSVKSYIQSGNVVFQTKKDKQTIANEISLTVEQLYHFKPKVLIMDQAELAAAINHNPFRTEVGKALHFFFLSKKPGHLDIKKLNELKADSELFELTDKVFYLHAPDGIGRSKLAAKVEKILQTPMTARNWNTVSKVLMMLESTAE